MMKLIIYIQRFLMLFASAKKRRKFNEKHLLFKASVHGRKDNVVQVPDNRNISIFIQGKNNRVQISDELDVRSKIIIKIFGDDNQVFIGKAHAEINLVMGSPDNREIYNAKFQFGKSYSGWINYTMMENNTVISIGDDCMFSYNIEMRCSDDHSVINEQGEVVNKAESIEIGNHVWIGCGSLILKNTTISDGCIVGARSIVAKRFDKNNCVIVGAPARVVKENIHWDGERPDKYKNKTNCETDKEK